MTSTPCKGNIIRFDTSDCVGEIYTEQGSAVKFGATACHGFKPKVGQTVVITGLRDLPIVGERATGVERSKTKTSPPEVAQKATARKGVAPIPY